MAPLTQWKVCPPAPSEYFTQLKDLPPFLAQCLYNRGLRTAEEARSFLEGQEEGTPFRLLGMNQAVARLRLALRQGERIAVYGDFDADGVAATALLTQVLTALGGQVTPYIPHRVDEGYGLNVAALDKLADQGCRLVVTVDCGARAVQEVSHAKRLGLEVIITDHHSASEELPPALAMINPKQRGCPYPFKELSGAGVAFKLAQALLRVEKQMPLFGRKAPLGEEDLLDLVALGTVADLSPLRGENRSLVKRGLEVLNRSPRPGIAALSAISSLRPSSITARTIGYMLGPRLNAAGRIADAMSSYRLLSTVSPLEAQELAQELEEKNQKRQSLTQETLERAREEIAGQEGEPILIAKHEGYPCGIIGLVAHRLCEEHYRPAVVMELREGECRGSARSILEFDIAAALDQCQDLLVKYGGHSLAAGFTVKNEALPALEDRLRALAAGQLSGLDLNPILSIDAQLPLTALVPEIFAISQSLEPLGPANPPPLLLSQGVEVREGRLVGEGHLLLTLTDGRVVWDAIAFGRGREAERLPRYVDIVYTPVVDRWQEERLRLQVEDFRPAEEL